MLLVHPWPPLYRSDSKVLILGTFPSPKSRETGFYYGHPQNVFWRTLADVLGREEPAAEVCARKAFLLESRVALWDVLHACDIDGAQDASIRNPVPNKFRPLIEATRISAIFTTGRAATSLFERCCAEEAGMPSLYLPSTSPANRAAQAKPAFREQWLAVARALETTGG
jgi:hypoxanthine-DNA glycosylase